MSEPASILDEPFGIDCPGCDAPLTCRNAGGYRCFCEKCVEAMPPFPTEPGGYFIEGRYPNFKWIAAEQPEG